jgi:hypothetical protein
LVENREGGDSEEGTVTDLQQLHRAILLDPHDELTRLAYRDARLEVGDGSEPLILTRWETTLRTFMSVADATFAIHPITDVVLTDRNPANTGGYSGAVWRKDDGGWTVDDGDFGLPLAEMGSLLPPVIYDLLPTMAYKPWTEYLSRQAAIAALSTACVARGRSLAGLPPLPV